MKHGSPLKPSAMSSPFSKRRRALDEERAEDRRLRRLRRAPVVDPDDQHREPEHVGEQHELLALVVGDVARAGEEVDPREPLLLGQLHLGRERVQMPDEALRDRLEALGVGARERRHDGVREVLVGQVARAHRTGASMDALAEVVNSCPTIARQDVHGWYVCLPTTGLSVGRAGIRR